jgi:alpha-D-ribose 1-methylphosphonate 5-triphosphate synthase subunit PhnH
MTTQQTFRAILEALARPTRPFPLTDLPKAETPGLSAVAVTLCDADTPIWLDPELAPAAGWFAFHTGAPVVTDPSAADFLFATSFDRLPPLGDLAIGTPEQPHRSATAVIDVTGSVFPDRFRAEGPGLLTYAEIKLPSGFAGLWRNNTDRFPMGVDLLLVDGDQVRGLPRTTRLEEV